MVVFDSTVLLLAIDLNAQPPIDPQTHKPLTHAKARLDFLVVNLSQAKERILIPTPVLAEVLVGLKPADIPKVTSEISSSAAFKVAPFDQVAAIELALLSESPQHKSTKLSPMETKAKVKFDRQII